MIRHVLGAFAQMERTRLVKKLRGARDRASAAAGRRIEGRKPVLVGDALALARKLRRRNPHTGERRSLRAISALLADAGHATPKTGKPFSAEVIRLALARASTASVVGTGPRHRHPPDHALKLPPCSLRSTGGCSPLGLRLARGSTRRRGGSPGRDGNTAASDRTGKLILA